VVFQAIEIYLKHAYPGPPPSAVRGRLETLAKQPAETFYDCPVLERNDPLTRYSIRLGNSTYPHMKMAIERSADGSAVFFKSDTHDRHCCPAPTSREYKVFLSLMESNESIASKIESAWAEAGVPTFKEYLRQDLQRRLAAAKAGED
jgi:hypothetical protein